MKKFNQLYAKIISESHIPFSSFIPVKTRDGMDTGWKMGPSDFSGRKRNPMRCSLDPNYIIAKDETILIPTEQTVMENPKLQGAHIAMTSYYKAEQGDQILRDKLMKQFGLDVTLNV